jgi:hypothetical protein
MGFISKICNSGKSLLERQRGLCVLTNWTEDLDHVGVKIHSEASKDMPPDVNVVVSSPEQ